jgi:hypothetical protein
MAAIRAPAPALDIFGILFGNPLKCLVSQFQQRFITLEVGRKVKIHLFTPLCFFIPQIQLVAISPHCVYSFRAAAVIVGAPLALTGMIRPK